MAYKQEKGGDIVINGFEKGIADSPELGIADIRSGNITAVPGELSVSPSMAAQNIPPTGLSSVAFSAATGTNIVTVSSTTGYYNGMGITIGSSSLPVTVQALVVGGGGAGGPQINGAASGGGGGGAGSVVFNASVPVTIGAYSVVTGGGGSGVVQSTDSAGGSGTLSSFNGISAAGGGGGGGSGNGGTVSNVNGLSGGSGGGGGGYSTPVPGGGGSGGSATNGSAGAAGAGSNAGNSGAGGGGGGANAAGTAGTGGTGGAGGAGISTTIAGNITATYGGGGGAGGSGSTGAGGAGGGGAGGGSNATANSGGGGGGSGATSGAGAVGRVQLAYLTGSLTATGGTITTNGAYTVHSFLTASTQTFTVSAVNPIVGNTYYIGNLTSTTFKLYSDPGLSQAITFLGNTTGTYSVPSFGTPVDKASYQYYASTTASPIYATFIIDNPGNCWYLNNAGSSGTGGTVASNSLQYTGNTGHATSGTNADFGVFAWNNYLFTVIGRTIGYINLTQFFAPTTPDSAWSNTWKTDLSYTQYQHQSVSATDDAVYICNAQTLASLLEKPGQTFDPTNTATYSYNTSALTLPIYDYAQSIAQLGTQLLIGGVLTFVYPWDRVSTSFSYPLICADANIKRIVSTNSNAYVFAGNRGRIYITNGQQIQVYKKIPDSLTGNPEAYFLWQDAIYLRNKIYFTMLADTNASSVLQTMGGIWSVGIDAGQTATELPTAGGLFNSNQLSYGNYGGSCPVLFPIQTGTPAGYGLGAAWVNTVGASNTGVDASSSTPYTGTQTYVDTDIIPIGGFFSQKTFGQIEYKLSKPLATGESVTLYQRNNLTDAFTAIGGNWQGTNTTSPLIGAVSDAKQVDFQKGQWVQFRAVLSSTASSPSYVRLTQLTIR